VASDSRAKTVASSASRCSSDGHRAAPGESQQRRCPPGRDFRSATPSSTP